MMYLDHSPGTQINVCLVAFLLVSSKMDADNDDNSLTGNSGFNFTEVTIDEQKWITCIIVKMLR